MGHSDKLPGDVEVAGPPTSCQRKRPHIKPVSTAIECLLIVHTESRSYISPLSVKNLSSGLHPLTLLPTCLVSTMGALRKIAKIYLILHGLELGSWASNRKHRCPSISPGCLSFDPCVEIPSSYLVFLPFCLNFCRRMETNNL